MKRFLLPLYVFVSLGYLLWRFSITQAWDVWYSWPLYISELIGITHSIIFLFLSRKIVHPVKPPHQVSGSVDIFIPTYNEEEIIVKMTAICAAHVRGVRDVYVLDDGARPNIKAMAEAIGVKYVARTDRKHAKAGNLNSGLTHSDADFILCLDCDHVPQPDFIEQTLGYFADERLAFVQTPQVFYNVQSLQFRQSQRGRTWNEQSMFFDSIQPSKNAHGAAFFCGSGAILRRTAIDSVGGFATDTITEDIHTSVKLHAKGWTSVYLNKELVHGLAAEDFAEYHKQRIRWSEGGFSLLFKLKDSPLVIKGLSLHQRLCYADSMFSPLFGLQRLFYFVLPIIILGGLFFNQTVDPVPALQYLAIFSAFLFFSYHVTYIFSHRTFHPHYTEQFNIANIFSTVIALKGILFTGKVFRVSAKTKRQNEVPWSYYVIWALFLLMVAADMAGLYYWFVFMGKNLSELFYDMTMIVLFWNTFNMYFVASFIMFLNTYNQKPKNIHTLALDHARGKFSYKTSKDGIERRASVDSFGIDGCSLYSREEILTDKIFLLIKSKNGAMQVPARVVFTIREDDGWYKAVLRFEGLSTKAEIRLTLFLFHEMIPYLSQGEPI